jgi:hypothetical protein
MKQVRVICLTSTHVLPLKRGVWLHLCFITMWGHICVVISAELPMPKWWLYTICSFRSGEGDSAKNDSVFYKMLHHKKTTSSENKIIKKLRRKCSNIELIVIRQSATGSCLGNSRPCSACLNMMKLFNIKTVYYSDAEGDIVYEKVSEMYSDHKSSMQRNF